MESLNNLNCIKELIYNNKIIISKNIDFENNKFTLFIKNNIIKNFVIYINKLDNIFYYKNIFIDNIKYSSLFIENSTININLTNIKNYNINKIKLDKYINIKSIYDKIYNINYFIFILFIETCNESIFINETEYKDLDYGTLFIIPYSIIFNISFNQQSESKVIVGYITETIKYD